MSDSFGTTGLRNRRRVVRVFARVVAGTTVLAAGVFMGTAALIGSAVHATSNAALQDQMADPVVALMAYAESSKHTLQERNRAVWALGQLGDARALPVLRKYFTDDKCDHARALCQHELRKAIRLCSGATNMTAYIWR